MADENKCEARSPSEYFHRHIQDFIERHSGEVVVIKGHRYGLFNPELNFYSKREYQAMMRRGTKRLRADRFGDGPVGGGAKQLDSFVGVFNIPRSMHAYEAERQRNTLTQVA